MNDSEARKLLERALGRQVEENQWEALKSEGYVKEVTDELEGIDYLAKKFRLFWPGQAIKRQSVNVTAEAEEGKKGVFSLGGAISTLFAWHAHGDEEVQAFRRDVIGKEMSEAFGRSIEIGLLNWKPFDPQMVTAYEKAVGQKLTKNDIESHDSFTVEAWISHHDKEERGKDARKGRKFAIGDRAGYSADGIIIADLEGKGNFLEYGVPSNKDDPGWRIIPVISGGILDRLRQLSERLAETYRWEIAEATVFVLIGGVPWVPRIKATYSERTVLKAATRINLSIDPTLPPEKVATYYKEQREKILSKPVREPRSKSIALAHFVGEMEIEQGKKQTDPKRWTWEQKRRSWNETFCKYFPDWKYEAGQESNFSRDYKSAKEKLLNPPFKTLQPFVRHFYDRPFDLIKKDGDD